MKRLAALLTLSISPIVASQAYATEVEGNRKQLHEWATCVAKKDWHLARDIVLDKPDAMSKALGSGFFFKPDCAPDGMNMTFQGVSFFGPIAEYVARSQNHPKAKRALEEVAVEMEAQSLAAFRQQYTSSSDHQSKVRYLSYLGICLHNRDSFASLALLGTKIESEQEEDSVEALGPSIQKCQVPGHAYDTSYDEIRGAIAAMRIRLIYVAAGKMSNA